ncbi:sulfotransferase 1C4-like [Cydia fagiglandana]|uniref:sulfotransferase 1C4-like n=1 Tax=Cydia fagiglandana TaxID=1458189 RepID=UPI002FEE1AEE
MAPWLELPYEISDVSPEENKLIMKCLLGYTKPFVKCGKSGYVMPGAFKKHAEEIYNMEVRPDDVWVVTFPRSGTTWTQEMVWLLKNDLDYNRSKEIPLHERFPMLELTSKIPELAYNFIKVNFMNIGNFQGLDKAAKTPSWELLRDAPSPRFIKTHLPLSLLPPKLLKTAKVIYVARDPRDVAVSYYYLHKLTMKGMIRTSFETFWETYKRDLLPWTPIIAHTNEAWMKRHEPNLHFVFYEDMIKDLKKEVHRISKFLGTTQYSDKELEDLSSYLSFDSLKKNKSVNNTVNGNGVQFMRKGEAGGWRSHFDAKMEVDAEEFMASRLQGLDLKYPSFTPNKECSYL